MDPYVGRTIGRKYRIDRRLAASGSGIVFAAMQMHQDMELGSVVIKMLPRKAIKDQKIVKRFIDEARAARTLTNPHVVRVFDLDHDTGHVPYLVQEYVEGDPLNEIIVQEGRLRPVRALAIALQIAEGMEEAHQKKILHRNLQPTNVIIRARLHEDFVKVIGFGMYETLDRTGGHRTVGAERYLAPEQIEGRGEDERTDIHALGVIVHEMLTGETPVPGGPGMAELLPEADANLIDIVEMMIERDPGNRPGNMKKVVSLLEQVALEHGLNLDITGRFTLPPEMDVEAKKQRTVPPDLPDEPARGRARTRGSRFHPAVIALAVVAGLILLAALLLGAYRLGAFLYARQPEPVEQSVEEPVAGEQPSPVDGTAPAAQEREAQVEPPAEEPPAGEADTPAKKKPRPGKKKPRPGKKKDTPWTKL